MSQIDFKIIYQNAHFIILDKPHGVLTVPARMKEDRRPVLGTELQNAIGQQIFPVHRLDYEVSGIVIFAKTPEAHRESSQWFEKRLVKKVYQAVSEGNARELIMGKSLLWESQLLRGKKRAYSSPVGKLSQTEAMFLGNLPFGLEWRLSPLTGRSHQLRYEMSKNGFPIFGDLLYGARAHYTVPGLDETCCIALRAIEIEFSQAAKPENWGLPGKISIATLPGVKEHL